MHCWLAPGNGTVNIVEVGEGYASFTLRPFTYPASSRLPYDDRSAVKAMEAIEHVLCDMPSRTTVGVVSISLLSSVPSLYNDHILHPPPHAATTNH